MIPPLTLLAVALGGALGAMARHLLSVAVAARLGPALPWGTMAVNLTGSLAIGLLAARTGPGPLHQAAVTGLIGGYTTFSTASLEWVELIRRRRPLAALLAGPGQLALCTAAAVLGLALGGA